MADEADRAQQDQEVYESRRKTNFELEKGEEGICIECDLPSPRLIKGVCAPCREINDRRKRHGYRD